MTRNEKTSLRQAKQDIVCPASTGTRYLDCNFTWSPNRNIFSHTRREMPEFPLVGLFALLAFCISKCECSWGDKHNAFRLCMEKEYHFCNQDKYPAVLPLHLRIFGWECTDEMKYQCMHNTTQRMLESGYPVMQFYGKVV